MSVRKIIQLPGTPIAPFGGNTIGVDPDEGEATPPADVISPLSFLYFIDPATTAALADQNGSIATPFATAAQAVAAGGGSFAAALSAIDAVAGATNVTLDECSISASITCTGTLTIRNLRSVAAGLTLTATSIVVDAVSLRALVFAGSTFVGAVSGFEGAVWSFGAAAATGGEFIDQGTRANPLSFPAEDTVRYFPGRRGVLCYLKVFSNVNMTFTLRKNAASTALAVTVNGAEGSNRNTFIEIGADETLDMMVTGAAGQAICSLVFV